MLSEPTAVPVFAFQRSRFEKPRSTTEVRSYTVDDMDPKTPVARPGSRLRSR
jgi:hypothetical protein